MRNVERVQPQRIHAPIDQLCPRLESGNAELAKCPPDNAGCFSFDVEQDVLCSRIRMAKDLLPGTSNKDTAAGQNTSKKIYL